MNGTGLEPVTPSLSRQLSGTDVVWSSALFASSSDVSGLTELGSETEKPDTPDFWNVY
jgi:hypothetical protein